MLKIKIVENRILCCVDLVHCRKTNNKNIVKKYANEDLFILLQHKYLNVRQCRLINSPVSFKALTFEIDRTYIKGIKSRILWWIMFSLNVIKALENFNFFLTVFCGN